MAHIWLRSQHDLWHAQALGPQHAIATACGDHVPAGQEPTHSGVQLLRVNSASGDAWVLLAPASPRVRVNGARLVGGLRVLRDRDETNLGKSGTFYFSSEMLAAVEPFSGAPTAVHCPRCKQAIDAGTDAVRCPGCGVVHHSSPALPCWEYAEHCALCDQPTDLSAGLRWTPEGA